ncbi:uncharacterized protein LOC118757324 [Rhagoletis pomonella]|uniref:uncharacterized protein LOC118757324 n=1 Tax=Rhagoletis pomonella TaxID=28610 RepID=UPI00177CF9F8|nr:uncharacterized protein LOC118757324 [Rhagoletis pomonella]
MASYIPPNSKDDLYHAHADNINSLVLNKLGDSHLCVLGDFNLCNVRWSDTFSNFGLTPNNITAPHESYLIDSLLSLNLNQINKYVNKLDRILDLIFVSDNIICNIEKCYCPMSQSDMHHLPLILKFELYKFLKSAPVKQVIFNYKSCDFGKLNNSLSMLNWDELLSGQDVSNCYYSFKTALVDLCRENVPILKNKPHKLPWYNRELKKLKNPRNKFFKKFKVTGNQIFFDKYQKYAKDFNCLDKFLYKNYILGVELNIKSSPKAFWQFIKSKKCGSCIPSTVFLDDKCASGPTEVASLFAEFFSANYVCDDGNSWPDINHDSATEFSFGTLTLSLDDVEAGISKLKPSTKADVDGFSALLLKNCPALILPPHRIFNLSLASGVFIEDWKITSINPILKSLRAITGPFLNYQLYRNFLNL